MPLTPSSACVAVSGLKPYLALAAFPQGSCQTALWWYLAGLEHHGCPRVLWCAVHSGHTPLLKLGTTITGSKEEGFGRTEALCSTGCIAGQQTGLNYCLTWIHLISWGLINLAWHSSPKEQVTLPAFSTPLKLNTQSQSESVGTDIPAPEWYVFYQRCRVQVSSFQIKCFFLCFHGSLKSVPGKMFLKGKE